MRIHLSLLNLAALLCVFTSPTFAPPPPPLAQVPSASSLVSTSSTSSHSVSTHHSEIDEPLPELLHSVSQDYESLDTLETADEIPGLDENIVSLKSVCPVESPTTSRSLFDFSSKFLAKIEGVNVSSLSPLERQVVEAVKDKDEDGLIELLQCVICYTPLGYKNMAFTSCSHLFHPTCLGKHYEYKLHSNFNRLEPEGFVTPGVFERLSRACPICRQDGGAVKAGMNRYTIIKDTLKILEESCDWKPEYKDEVELMRLLVATTRGSNVGAGHYTAEGETAVERFMDMEREMIVDRAMAIVGSLALTLFGLLMIVLAKLFDQAGFTDDPSKLNPIFNPYM